MPVAQPASVRGGAKTVATIAQLADYLVNGFWQYSGTIAHHFPSNTITYINAEFGRAVSRCVGAAGLARRRQHPLRPDLGRCKHHVQQRRLHAALHERSMVQLGHYRLYQRRHQLRLDHE